MFAKVLVGFDDSPPPSRAALIEAAHWVKRRGGSTSLVHAVFFDTEEFGIAPEQHEKLVQNGVRFCTSARDLYVAEFGIEISSQVRAGDPHEAILAATSSNGADLVVLGTFGRKGLNRLIMGSVTSQVIVHSGDIDLSGIGNLDDVLDGGERRATRAIRATADSAGMLVKSRVERGNVSSRILEAAEEERADLIVIGTPKRRGFFGRLFGDHVIERALDRAPCPVLVVGTS